MLFFILFSCRDNIRQAEPKLPELRKNIGGIPKQVSCNIAEETVFKKFVTDLTTGGYNIQKLKDWNITYKNHIISENYNLNDSFIVLPENTIWKGIKRLKTHHNREVTEIKFDNTKITEILVKRNKNKSFIADIKIVQFLFQNEEEVQKSTEKLKLISYYTINTAGLKNPNCWWIHNCAIYFCRTRSASTSFKTVIKTFEKKNGNVEIKRW
ncbi:MAG: hypothetical protein L3J35_06590 [Bacteroidales bacterium]|nr:hypothetical protein [Bacteroidales bacterium]